MTKELYYHLAVTIGSEYIFVIAGVDKSGQFFPDNTGV